MKTLPALMFAVLALTSVSSFAEKFEGSVIEFQQDLPLGTRETAGNGSLTAYSDGNKVCAITIFNVNGFDGRIIRKGRKLGLEKVSSTPEYNHDFRLREPDS